MAALGKGAALLVYPGGDHETYRPSWHSGEIDFGHRSGFVRLALATDVPIVPVVAIGGQETALFLTRGERLSHLLALDRLLRLKVLPIQIAPPFGVTVLDLPGRIPLPSQITIQVLPRIDLRRRFGPDPDEEAVYNAVTTMMQEALDELSAERDLPVVGTLGSRRREERSRRGARARRPRARGRGRDRGRRSQEAGWADIEPAAQCVALHGKQRSSRAKRSFEDTLTARVRLSLRSHPQRRPRRRIQTPAMEAAMAPDPEMALRFAWTTCDSCRLPMNSPSRQG